MVITPAVLLRDIHNGLLANFDCKDSAPPPAQPGARTRPGRDSQDGVSQQEEAAPLFLPQLDRLHEAYIVRGEDDSYVAVAATPLRILLHTRSSSTGSRLKTSSKPLCSRVALSSFAFTRSSASWPL